MATLFIFAGLPGTGKTTLSQMLAQSIGTVHLRIDTIEQALREMYEMPVIEEGYQLSYRIAMDNLQLGTSVIADSCNPLEITRKAWEKVALETESAFVNIEVICSDTCEHRKRIETRTSNISGLKLPSWADVENREYDFWSKDRIIIDTANKSKLDSLEELCLALSKNLPNFTPPKKVIF